MLVVVSLSDHHSVEAAAKGKFGAVVALAWRLLAEEAISGLAWLTIAGNAC